MYGKKYLYAWYFAKIYIIKKSYKGCSNMKKAKNNDVDNSSQQDTRNYDSEKRQEAYILNLAEEISGQYDKALKNLISR